MYTISPSSLKVNPIMESTNSNKINFWGPKIDQEKSAIMHSQGAYVLKTAIGESRNRRKS